MTAIRHQHGVGEWLLDLAPYHNGGPGASPCPFLQGLLYGDILVMRWTGSLLLAQSADSNNSTIAWQVSLRHQSAVALARMRWAVDNAIRLWNSCQQIRTLLIKAGLYLHHAFRRMPGGGPGSFDANVSPTYRDNRVPFAIH